MTVVALIVAMFALVVSIVSAGYSRRATRAVEAGERRERMPKLVISTDEEADDAKRTLFYSIRNNGPQDLDSVVLYRARTPDGIKYPLAVVGSDWADDLEMGPLQVAEEKPFVISIGSRRPLPEFHIRIVCRAGRDTWTLTEALQAPRGAPHVH